MPTNVRLAGYVTVHGVTNVDAIIPTARTQGHILSPTKTYRRRSRAAPVMTPLRRRQPKNTSETPARAVMNADPETDLRTVSCPADEYIRILAYLERHGCEVTYLNTIVEEDGFAITHFVVARPPKLPE